MPGLANNPLFVEFTTVCVLLMLKAQMLAAATAATRGKLKKFINARQGCWNGSTPPFGYRAGGRQPRAAQAAPGDRSHGGRNPCAGFTSCISMGTRESPWA